MYATTTQNLDLIGPEHTAEKKYNLQFYISDAPGTLK